jgi:hypothetical protein
MESKKRKVTFEQVQLLNRNFKLENKLELERKMQLAIELGTSLAVANHNLLLK